MASARRTSRKTLTYADFIERSRFPKAPYQRVLKQPGSKRLVYGEWVEVKPGDEDAQQAGAKMKMGRPNHTPGGGDLGGA